MKTSECWIVVRRRLGPCLPAVLLCLLLAGCGGKKSQVELAGVTGKVVQGGQPVVAAEVMFIPKGGGSPSGARTDENGRFELRFTDGRPGAVPGKHSVIVTEAVPELPAPTGGAETPPPPPVKEPLELRTEAEVKSGSDNDFSFEMPPSKTSPAKG